MNPAPDPSRSRRAQQGLATLATLLLLLLSALLAAAWSQRSALNEIRSSGHQLQATSALEAAEGGLEWAQAMLSSNHAVGADCQPSSAKDATTFRSRYLHTADPAGRFAPRAAGTPGAVLQLACMRDAQRWSCSCPADGAPLLSADGTDAVPMFLLTLAAGVRPGSIDVQAIGCSHVASPCLSQTASRADADVRLRVTLALLPALLTPPVAGLTTAGSIEAGAAALGLHNADALSGGLVAHAGGAVNGGAIRISTTPGAATAGAVLSGDPTLASLTPLQFFNRHFGTDPVSWKYQPGVLRLPCRGDCSADLLALIEPNADVARIAIDGDLVIDGNLQIGSRAKPVVLVIEGDLMIRGPAQIHGLVFARNLRWDGVAVGGGGLLLGAALLSGGYSGDGGADLVYDPTLMLRLKRQSGTWVRVPGSWTDASPP